MLCKVVPVYGRFGLVRIGEDMLGQVRKLWSVISRIGQVRPV
jgi:hypothetical protein